MQYMFMGVSELYMFNILPLRNSLTIWETHSFIAE